MTYFLCKESRQRNSKEKGTVIRPCLFRYRKTFLRGKGPGIATAGSRPRPTGEPRMYRHGGSGTPEFKVENRKNRWKNSLSRRFSRFFRFDFSFGGLGGVQPQSRAPRLGSSGDFFGSFLVGQKGTYPRERGPPGKAIRENLSDTPRRCGSFPGRNRSRTCACRRPADTAQNQTPARRRPAG